ncbi:RagB/SusD family nutrient uptake outer membrane protein [Mucilaginibacter terrae]|uniref:RagB/SusD family nutrient uptake outer membrane protein n=1 Tax=Mucilaginibacter terrae TaxID=1955052 RepID=UPI00362EED75
MKKLFIIIIGVIALGSCKKLDLAPESNLTAATYYKTPADAQAAIGACYGQITTIYGASDGFMFIDLATTDDGVPFLSGVGDRVPLWQYKITPSNTFINMFSNSYAAIQKSNIVIARVPLIEMDANLKQQYVAEAKYLRALHYFNLLRLYGGVPVVTDESLSLEGLDKPKNTVDEVYNQIEQDLKDAEVLPVTYAAADKGRATRGAAKGLLAKVYLTRAGTTVGSPYWALAAAKAKEVIDIGTTGVYDLWANYADAFSLANKGGKEYVFEIQYKTDILGNGLGRLYGVRSAPIYIGGGAGTARVSATLYNSFVTGDRRRDVNFLSSYTFGGTVFPLSVTDADPTKAVAFNKLWDQTATLGTGNGKSFPYMRYSEILLIYAEALNEAGNGPNAEAYNAFKRVHDRAGLTTPALGVYNYLSFKQAVWLERRLEFPFEMQRRFDLVRTGRLIDAVKSEVAFGRAPEIQPYHYLLPIPQGVLTASPALVQNPGY